MQPRLKPDVNAMDLLEWALEEEDGGDCAALISSASVPLAIRRRALELLDTHHKSARLRK